MRIKILFRACNLVSAVNGGQSARPLSLDKDTIIKICALSVKKCFKNIDHDFVLIGDRLDSNILGFLQKTLNPSEIFNSSEPLGSGGSLLKSSEIANTISDDTIVFFCEDDYLYLEDVFSDKLCDFVSFASKNINSPWFIHPTDYPDQYTRSFDRSFLIALPSGYWREVSSTTGTFLCSAKDYKKFYSYFNQCFESSDKDGNLSKIFKKEALCFSPIPSIGTHLHIGTMPYYIDWNKEINKYLEFLK